MYLRIGNRIINANQIVDAFIVEVGESLNNGSVAETRTIMIRTTADHQILLTDQDADMFLIALPTYKPTPEGYEG